MLLVGVFICLAAYNSGNNTFYLIGSGLFGMVALSWLHLIRYVRGFELRAYAAPDGIFVGSEGSLTLMSRSTRGSMSVHLEHPELEGPVRVVATESGTKQSIRVLPRRRGRWGADGISASTRAPFGIWRRRFAVTPSPQPVVFPEPAARFTPSWTESADRQRERGGTLRAGSGNDFLGLREYHPEDGLRRIHWKSLAKTGRLMSRLLEDEDSRVLTVTVSTAIPEDTTAWRRRFELALSRATAAILHAESTDLPFRLRMPERTLSTGRGRAHRNQALTALAEAQPVVGGDPLPPGPGLHFQALDPDAPDEAEKEPGRRAPTGQAVS